MAFHVIHFVHRYPPAIGGAELYIARLHEYLRSSGIESSVWTTTAVQLGDLWKSNMNSPPHPIGMSPLDPYQSTSPSRGEVRASWENAIPPTSPLEGEVDAIEAKPNERRVGGNSKETILRFPTVSFPLRRYILKALSLFPHRPWQALTQPVNPLCPGMWREADRYGGPLNAVHATAFPYAFPIMCARRLARCRKVPLLLTPFLHLGDPQDPNNRIRSQYTRPHLRWLLQQADLIFAQTETERQAIIGMGIEANRVIKQGLGVEPLECTGGNRERARRDWNVNNDECMIGHLANLSVEKGTVELLQASALLWQQGERFRVVLAGEEMPNFQRFWESYQHKDRVIKLGKLDATQKRDFYAGIDCFALPSRSDSFGLVLLEAWANSKPVIVARAGGPAELVRDGIDGYVASDVGELQAKLYELIANKELRFRMGQAGCERISAEFNWQDKLELFRIRMATTIVNKTITPTSQRVYPGGT